ncbi:4-hydroxyphenylpyruvate dioxygenase [Kiloniella laminariae]|uniref:4-hydroxyphenylpyruvate dioxygenase n=1 Tax=Kiloniella laminariae TaxID=454162 RepID=UPI0003701CF1|nr:4-hydroxyphenylpyruvate dioxygenase [Kiloniella laminariae]
MVNTASKNVTTPVGQSHWDNPAGTLGFEFVEFTTKNPAPMRALLASLGFKAKARHRSKQVTLFTQDNINFLLNEEPDSFAAEFANEHGSSVCAVAFAVQDAGKTAKHLKSLGAELYESKVGPMELNIPAIKGVGESLVYLVDRQSSRTIYDIDFIPLVGEDSSQQDVGLTYIDHLTNNVFQGRMNYWAEFYEKFFNFREIRYFDIEGKLTGLHSRAMTSPCGNIRIPINESADDKSQIAEYLKDYNGEGVQHIAMGTDDIYETVRKLRENGVDFMPAPPEAYYNNLDTRVPGHGEDVNRLKEHGILLDGAPTEDGGILLQIFTKTCVGPIFFEIIQRKGDEGFGEGNFKALFESMEQDQIDRGVLKDE